MSAPRPDAPTLRWVKEWVDQALVESRTEGQMEAARAFAVVSDECEFYAAEAEARPADLADFVAVCLRSRLGPPEIMGSAPGQFDCFWRDDEGPSVGVSFKDGVMRLALGGGDIEVMPTPKVLAETLDRLADEVKP